MHLENSVASSSASVDGQQVLDLTGLGTPRHTLNGTSLTLSSYTYNGSPVNEERRTTVTDLVSDSIVNASVSRVLKDAVRRLSRNN